LGWFREWRRARILKQASLDADLWQAVVARYEFIAVLSEEELARLAELTLLFVHEKSIHGARGTVIDDTVRVGVAAQAAMLVLNLGLDFYRGWVEVIVYPDEFVAEFEYIDEAGVAHHVAQPMSGESWENGPVLISWADAEHAGRGHNYNVVIHEFAHKLDMLNGGANGFPPLHADMSRASWSGAFGGAYEDFCKRVEREELAIDDYAAESPAEFFAVMSEAFFEAPFEVRKLYPDVYEQLRLFYRQDPAARVERADAAFREGRAA
jgi:Mlc titration factor MtfA (ptsG expression regulator)